MPSNIRKIILGALLLLVGASPAVPLLTSSPKLHELEIIGPENVEPGQLVRCTVADYQPNDTAWFTVGDSERYGLNGANLVFAAPAGGDVVVTCAIIRNGELFLSRKVITVGRPPAPKPETPKPETPKPLSDVSVKIVDLATKYSISREAALQIASNLRQAVKESTTPRGLVEMTMQLNSEVDFPEKANEDIATLLQNLSANGTMVSYLQHQQVWTQMADGFEHYGGNYASEKDTENDTIADGRIAIR